VKKLEFYKIIINWLHEKLTPKQFLIFSSILVGLTAGLAAVLVKMVVYFFHKQIQHISFQFNLVYVIAPFIGIGLTILFVKYFNRDKLGKGISNILYAIAKKSSFLPFDQVYSHLVTSSLTVGFGGSAGLESPMVTTGSAIGSNFGRTYKLSYKERTLLLACGAAAGISGAFNTPIAGVLFALEVLLVDANITAFIPLLIASATGGLCSKIILNEDILLSFSLKQPFNYYNVPWYCALGILAGLASVYYARLYEKVENAFKPYKERRWMGFFIGCSLLGVLIFLFPPLFGEGYDSIKALADLDLEKLTGNSPLKPFLSTDWFLLAFLAIIFFTKAIATGLTLGTGGNGGNFAPSLFIGSLVGFLFSTVINKLGIDDLPVSNFTIVAMAGILSGIFHAPLTGIFLIAEITGGYELIIPLMIVSALSYTISKYFRPLSIDMKKLAEKDNIVVSDTDSYLLSRIDIEKMIETDFIPVNINQNLGDLIKIIATSRRNSFPVLDSDENLKGIIQIEHIREVMFKNELYGKVTVKELMRKSKEEIHTKDSIQAIMKKFEESQLWNLPVTENGRYIGFISKSSLLEQYRENLVKNIIE